MPEFIKERSKICNLLGNYISEYYNESLEDYGASKVVKYILLSEDFERVTDIYKNLECGARR